MVYEKELVTTSFYVVVYSLLLTKYRTYVCIVIFGSANLEIKFIFMFLWGRGDSVWGLLKKCGLVISIVGGGSHSEVGMIYLLESQYFVIFSIWANSSKVYFS